MLDIEISSTTATNDTYLFSDYDVRVIDRYFNPEEYNELGYMPFFVEYEDSAYMADNTTLRRNIDIV